MYSLYCYRSVTFSWWENICICIRCLKKMKKLWKIVAFCKLADYWSPVDRTILEKPAFSLLSIRIDSIKKFVYWNHCHIFYNWSLNFLFRDIQIVQQQQQKFRIKWVRSSFYIFFLKRIFLYQKFKFMRFIKCILPFASNTRK